MCIWSPTYQQSVFKRYHSDKHFSDFLPTRWRQKSTGIDVEQNDFTVTFCISDCSWHLYSDSPMCSFSLHIICASAGSKVVTDWRSCMWHAVFRTQLHLSMIFVVFTVFCRQYVTVLFFTRVMFNIHCFGVFLHNQPYPFSVATCLIKEES